jgi:hypothetical protein
VFAALTGRKLLKAVATERSVRRLVQPLACDRNQLDRPDDGGRFCSYGSFA